MKILIIGASGMIGSTVFRVLSEQRDGTVFGTVRNPHITSLFSRDLAACLIANIDLDNQDALVKVLEQIRPEVVINCAGLTKHKPEAEDPLEALPINALMPHRLAALCQLIGARLVHISTDCVFSGTKGNYTEEDYADANDVYGRSKLLGEVQYPHTITLRTSTIGHELQSKHGLLEWFLSQEQQCKGYTHAVFSGLPTVVFAEVIRDIVIPNKALSGLYHVSAAPIAKYDLLKMIARIYEIEIEIIADGTLEINRSLNAERFHAEVGYVAPTWPELIETMYRYK